MFLLQLSEHAHEVAHNGMQTTWTTANLITLGAVAGTFIAGWIKLIVNKTQMEARIKQLERDMEKTDQAHKSEIDAIVVAKTTIKQELKREMDERIKSVHKRIDDTQKQANEDRAENKTEFKAINNKLDDINMKLGQLMGKLGVN